MKEKQNKINRRNFLKTVGAAGLGSVLASVEAKPGPNVPLPLDPNALEKPQRPKIPLVPKRRLGKLTQLDKAGKKKVPVKVPVLSLGMMFNAADKQLVLRKSVQYGVTYWDTAYSYSGGNSELGVGKFLKRYPELRKQMFIASKASRAETVEDVEKRLQESLKRLKTDYIDLYYGVHILSDAARLTDELKQWAESAKERKLIRFFGFSTHKNMAECLTAAARLDWIDVVMTIYNFRLMQDKKLNAAIDACHKAGIGLIAMKAVGRGSAKKIKTEEDRKLVEHFLKMGFTEAQAKIKVVLQDKRFSSVCVGRGNIKELDLNVAAVLDKTRLTQADMEVFTEYARATCSGYCAGCAYICDSALPDVPYVSDIMRYLMYYNSYGEKEMARELFVEIPARARARLATTDYSLAEARCPQHLPIGELVAEAVSKLA